MKFPQRRLLVFSLFGLVSLTARGQTSPAPIPPEIAGHNIGQVTRYYGNYKETGVTGTKEPLSAQVWFEKPSEYFVQFLGPVKFGGFVASYKSGTLRLLYDKMKVELIYRNLPLLHALNRNPIEAASATGSLQLGGRGTLAGYPVREVTFKANGASAVTGGAWKVYDKYSFPVLTQWNLASGGQFVREFTRLQFNYEKPKLDKVDAKTPPKMPEIGLPPGTFGATWDFGEEGLTESEVRRGLDFRFHMPKKMPAGLTLQKIVHQKGPMMAFVALFANEKDLVLLNFNKDNAVAPGIEGWGLSIPTRNHQGVLIPGIVINTYAFNFEGTRYVLTSTLPVEQLLSIADGIGPDEKIPVVKPVAEPAVKKGP